MMLAGARSLAAALHLKPSLLFAPAVLSQRGLRTYSLPQSAAARVRISGRHRDQSHLLPPHNHNHPGGHAPGAWGGDNKEPGAFDWSSVAGYVGFPLARLPSDYVQRHLELLPQPSELRAASQDPEAAALQEALRSLAADCSGPGMWVWTYGATGALLSSLLKPMAAAYNAQRGFHTPAVDSLCASPHDLTCIGLEPLSSCSREGPGGARTSKATAAAAGTPLEKAPDISMRAPAEELLPQRFASRGLFWWTAQALGRLTALTPPAAAQLEALRERWGWAQLRPVLGVHIRQGDTCHRGVGKVIKARRCDPPSAYLEAMLPLVRRYGVRGVFVASDSDDAIRFVRESRALRSLGIPVLSFDGAVDRAKTYGRFKNFDKAIASGTIDMVADRGSVVRELHLLAEADVLLGKHTSNMMRHALALGTFKRGGSHVVPFRSLDATWCADYEFFAGNSTVGARSFKC